MSSCGSSGASAGRQSESSSTSSTHVTFDRALSAPGLRRTSHTVTTTNSTTYCTWVSMYIDGCGI